MNNNMRLCFVKREKNEIFATFLANSPPKKGDHVSIDDDTYRVTAIGWTFKSSAKMVINGHKIIVMVKKEEEK